MFTRNTTDALNLLATAVPGPVLCLDVEHHANLLPWRSRTHRTLPAAATVAQTLADLEAALRAHPTALLTVTGASNVTGEVLPLDTDRRDRARARAPAWPSTPHSSPRTAGSTSPRPAWTTWRCPGTSSTRPSARGRWSGAATGSTPRRPTSPAGAP